MFPFGGCRINIEDQDKKNTKIGWKDEPKRNNKKIERTKFDEIKSWRPKSRMQKVQGLALQFNVGKKMKRKKVGAIVKR